jgi:hypothetical protein
MRNSNIQIINHKELDKVIWDKKICSSASPSFFMLSWVLDILHPNWDALVYLNYEAFMPIPKAKKIGLTYVFQPKFIRSLSIFNEACQAYFQTWFYNKNTNSCEQIGYSGCSSKGFPTKEECEACKCNE